MFPLQAEGLGRPPVVLSNVGRFPFRFWFVLNTFCFGRCFKNP
jgi:hypothetical protein